MVSEHFPSGVDPKKMEEIRAAASGITGEIWKCADEGTFLVKLNADNAKAQQVVNSLIDQMPQQIAMQFQTFFNIQGKIKKKKTILGIVKE